MFTGEPNRKRYTAGDIHRYHRGLMSPAERNALEKAALEDPFLEEALEGFALAPDAAMDMPLLNTRLDDRVRRKRRSVVVFMRTWGAAAAVLVLVLLGGGLFIRYLGRHSKGNTIAQKAQVVAPQPAVKTAPARDSIVRDSVVMALPKPHLTIPQPLRNQEALNAPNGGAAKARRGEVAKARNEEALVAQPAESRTLADSSQAAVRQNSAVAAAPPPADLLKKLPGIQVDTQGNIITNRIIDNQNQPVPFASIHPLNSKSGVTSDANGYFKLQLSDTNALLSVSAVGYATREVNAKQQTPIQLDQIHTSLNDVVVVALDNKKASPSEAKRANGPYHAVDDSSNLEPIDGWDNYNYYLSTNLHLPEEVLHNNIHGDVALSFRLDKEGNPIHVNVDHSLCNDCDAEAKRLLLQGPHWKKKGKGRRGRLRVHF